jgi:ferredoxin
MMHAVTEPYINFKYMDCFKVCPVGANLQHYEGGLDKWLEFNASYVLFWPNIASKGVPPEDANRWHSSVNKLKHFCPEPARQS